MASPDVSSPRLVEPPGDGTVALALSGGGKRAALFSLGALMALVDTGVNPRVGAITSVSGGSITNAAVAHRADLQSTTPEEFDELCDQLATELITTRHRITAPIVGLTVFVTFVFLQLSGPGRVVNELINRFVLGSSLIGAHLREGQRTLVALAMLVFTLLGAVLVGLSLRSPLQTMMIGRLFKTSGADDPLTMGRLKSRSVRHVLCLTDLESGCPLHVADDLLIAADGVTTTDGRLTVAEIVTASAAVPGALYPIFLRYRDSNRRGKKRTAIVTDGGVFNNLATDWILQDTLHSSLDWSEPAARPFVKPDSVIAIDASAPPRTLSIRHRRTEGLAAIFPFGIMLEFFFLRRCYNVTYSSGLSIRQRLLQIGEGVTIADPAVSYVAISESPFEYARICSRIDDPVRQERAKLALAALKKLNPEAEWEQMRNTTCSMKTELARVEPQPARNVALHGYYSMRVAMQLRFGIPLTSPSSRWLGAS